MTISTKHFGEIKYEESSIITFPDGLPGFQENTRYILLDNEDAEDDMFRWLQCVDNAEIALAIMDVYPVIQDYNPMVDEEALADLGDLSGNPLEIYNVCVIPEDLRQMRVNLKAPIIINPATRIGKQVVVQNDEYKVRHHIFNDVQEEAGR